MMYMVLCCVWYRLDDVAGQLNVDLVAAITDAVCPTADCGLHSNTPPQCRGKLITIVKHTYCSLTNLQAPG